MRIEVVMALPTHCDIVSVELAEGGRLADVLALAPVAALDPQHVVVAHAIHGVLAKPQQELHDGDRVELLRSLQADPKESRRRRASAPTG